MKKIRTFIILLLCIVTVLAGCKEIKKSPAPQETVIAQDGISKAVIVVDADAPGPVQYGASELADFLNQITGAKFEIANEAQEGKTNLFVGPKAAKSIDPDFSTEGLEADGIIIKTVGSDLILAGDPPRGTLYAVYTFLEDELGCRWWSSKASTIPNIPTIELSNLNVRYVPPLEYREPFWTDAFDGDWAARNKSNGSSERLEAKHGGKHNYAGFVHTFFSLIPPDKYFDEHPEWFSELDGKRNRGNTQLCLSNEQMLAELVKNLRERLRNTPEATIASVSQNDWDGHCLCSKCSAIEAEEESPAGSVIRFVNAVAEDIEEEFPHVAISTLAYQYTRKPPKLVKPRHNVIVRLCSIECSFSVPLSHERNQAFRDDIIGWSKICNRLYIWDYTTNFKHHILPHPNLRVLGPNVKFLVDHGAKGIFEQGAYTTNGAEMAELRAWVLAKALWNPELDGQKLIDEFLNGYYGPAGKHIKAYLDLMHDEVDKTGDWLGCFAGIEASNIDIGWQGKTSKFITFETLSQGLTHLKAAEEAVADNPELRFRVQCAKLPVMYAFMMCWKPMYEQAQSAEIQWPLSDSIDQVYNNFVEIARKKNITRLNEWNEGYGNLENALKKAKE